MFISFHFINKNTVRHVSTDKTYSGRVSLTLHTNNNAVEPAEAVKRKHLTYDT